MKPLSPIPVSPRVIWRQFRERVVPPMMFVGLVALAIVLWSRLYGMPSPKQPHRVQPVAARRTGPDAIRGSGMAQPATETQSLFYAAGDQSR